MPWVPFQDVTTEGFGYTFTDEGGTSVGFGGTITLPFENGSGDWTMDLYDGGGPFTGRARVQFISFLASGTPGDTYHPAVIGAESGVEGAYFDNHAPPAPSANWGGSGVCNEFYNTAFDPAYIVEFDSAVLGWPIARVTFDGTRTGVSLNAAQLSFSMIFEIWVEDDVDPPVDTCFWEATVNAVEDCGGDEPTEPGVTSFYNSVGDGGSYGRFIIRIGGGGGDNDTCNDALLDDLVGGGADVEITGVHALDAEPPLFLCGDPVGPVEFEPTSGMPMTYDGSGTPQYYWNRTEESDIAGGAWYYLRISVGGTTYYGLARMGSGGA